MHEAARVTDGSGLVCATAARKDSRYIMVGAHLIGMGAGEIGDDPGRAILAVVVTR